MNKHILCTEDQVKRRNQKSAVCIGIALTRDDVPTEMIGAYGLGRHLHSRGERPEFRFLYRDSAPRLPVIQDGQLLFVRWGNGCGQSKRLPRTGWTWMEDIESGNWRSLEPAEVVIPASFGLEQRGVWFKIAVGIRGLLVPDENGNLIVYMIVEQADDYYRVMTGSSRMPILVEQRI